MLVTDRKLIEADRRGGGLTGESWKQLNNDGASDTVICCLLLQFYPSNQSGSSSSVIVLYGFCTRVYKMYTVNKDVFK